MDSLQHKVAPVRDSEDEALSLGLMKLVEKTVPRFAGNPGPQLEGDTLNFLNICKWVKDRYIKADDEEDFCRKKNNYGKLLK